MNSPSISMANAQTSHAHYLQQTREKRLPLIAINRNSIILSQSATSIMLAQVVMLEKLRFLQRPPHVFLDELSWHSDILIMINRGKLDLIEK